MRAIDGDALFEILGKRCERHLEHAQDFKRMWDKEYAYIWTQIATEDGIILNIIREQPTIDPVRKGKWIKISPAGIYECSECGQNVMTSDIDVYRWCHGCGAKMGEGEE